MSIGEGWAQGARQGEKIGGVIFIGFRILWFFIRVTWWLGQFLDILAGRGHRIPGPARAARRGPDRGFRSVLSGSHPLAGCAQRAVVSRGERTAGALRRPGAMGSLAYRRNAISRLVRRGAIFRHAFSAVNDSSDVAPNPAASADFIQEMRHNITLDNLDPEGEDIARYDLHDNYAEAKNALDQLDWVLTQRGWQDTGDRRGHWYARVYERSILWDTPMPDAERRRQRGSGNQQYGGSLAVAGMQPGSPRFQAALGLFVSAPTEADARRVLNDFPELADHGPAAIDQVIRENLPSPFEGLSDREAHARMRERRALLIRYRNARRGGTCDEVCS